MLCTVYIHFIRVFELTKKQVGYFHNLRFSQNRLKSNSFLSFMRRSPITFEKNPPHYRRLLSVANARCAHTRSNHVPSAPEKTPVPPSVDPRRITTSSDIPATPPPGRGVETRQRMPWRHEEGRSFMMVALFFSFSLSLSPLTSPSVLSTSPP